MSICAHFAGRNERHPTAKLGQGVQRIGRYVSGCLGVLARIRDLLAAFIAEPSRFVAFYQRSVRTGPARDGRSNLSRHFS